MLRFVEEVLLLLLDYGDGDTPASMPLHSLDFILAGALLMDLALEDRIDTDPERLFLIDATPVGDSLLDDTLDDVAKDNTPRFISYWLERTARRGDEIREKTLAGLVDKGILESDESSLFFLSPLVRRSRRYPTVDGQVTEEVQTRIMRLLFSDDIPDPRDIAIVSLAAAGDMFRHLLSREELAQAQERIDLIVRLDLIGQSVASALRPAVAPVPTPSVRPAVEIPEAPGWPILGNVFDMAGDLRGFLTRQYLELGPIFQVRALNAHYIVLAGPEANNFVQKNGRAFLRSYEIWQGFNSAWGAKDALTGMDGPGHVRMRKVHRRAFSGRFIEDRLDEVVDITQRVIAQWQESRPISVHSAMQKLIAEQIAVLTTGVSALAHIDDLIATLNGLLSVHVMKQRPSLILRLPRLRRARKRMGELYDLVMAYHEDEGRAGRDLIDDLLDLHHSDPQFFPETDLQVAVLGPFFAGIETSANTTSFMLYAVLKHPGLLERMTAEADYLFNQGTVTAEGLSRTDVTRRIFMETLRMYPVIPGLPRTAANSFEFGGYTVPAGSKIIVGNTVPHHLPHYYPDPERFDIDRFLPERAEHSQPGAFAPFGLGTHRCLGSSFAEVQVILTLLTIARHAEIELDPSGYNLKIEQVPAPHPAKSFKFRLLRRRQHSH